MNRKRALGRLLAQEIPSARLSEVNGQAVQTLGTVTQDWRTQNGGSGYYDSGRTTPDQNSDDDITLD
jgi:hypothetical protein